MVDLWEMDGMMNFREEFVCLAWTESNSCIDGAWSYKRCYAKEFQLCEGSSKSTGKTAYARSSNIGEGWMGQA